MEEETQILARLSVVESKLEDNIKVLTRIVEKHDDSLYGKSGSNGLTTTVSKLKDLSNTAKWVVGTLFVLSAGQVVAMFIK